MSLTVFYEATPNPDSMKFNLTQKISDRSFHVTTALEAESSPIAKKLFGFPWMSRVFVGHDFITVTKQDWVGWDVIAEPLSDLILEHFEQGHPAYIELTQTETDQLLFEESDTESIKKIKTVIHQEIKPAVAMDGGDVEFEKYEDNIVYIHMKGACVGCPSSEMTLKQGIEVRLKEAVPEIQEVIALES